MEIEEMLFRKHERDAQRGRELLTDAEFIKMEHQWEEASKDIRSRPIPDFGLKDFINEIVEPRAKRTAGAIEKYCIDLEKRAMQIAMDFNSRAVYVAEWTEVTEADTPERRGYSFDMCFAVYPYSMRSLAFKRIQENGGRVRIIDFKQLIEMPLDEFMSIRSENHETAKKLREKFGGNSQMSHRTIFEKIY